MKILGRTNNLDSSVSLYLNGKIVSAISEERFNRIKNYHGLPKKALSYTLKKFDLKLKEFDYIIYGIIDNINPDKNISSNFLNKFLETPKNIIKE